MKFNVSFWEQETFLKNPDVIVVGGGIVGVNAAISLKESHPNLDVLIIERGNVPIGASTRNAGFACFGSVTELLDDLSSDTEENVFSLLNERFQGLEFMKSRLSKKIIDYKACGAYEVFDKNQDFTALSNNISYLNKKIEEHTGLNDTFTFDHLEKPFPGLSEKVIYNQHEGSLHPGKMMMAFYDFARTLGVRFLSGINVTGIVHEDETVKVSSDQYVFTSRSCIICTNGFTELLDTSNLITKGSADIRVKAVRNQVLLTEPIAELDIDTCYHFDKGYVYFRNVGNRLLIGGGRNIAIKEEETAEFGSTEKIENYLMDILYSKIGISHDVKIDHKWSGILGVGRVKSPVLRKVSEGVIFAVRLGGMGVALGSRLGDQAAKLLLKNL